MSLSIKEQDYTFYFKNGVKKLIPRREMLADTVGRQRSNYCMTVYIYPPGPGSNGYGIAWLTAEEYNKIYSGKYVVGMLAAEFIGLPANTYILIRYNSKNAHVEIDTSSIKNKTLIIEKDPARRMITENG